MQNSHGCLLATWLNSDTDLRTIAYTVTHYVSLGMAVSINQHIPLGKFSLCQDVFDLLIHSSKRIWRMGIINHIKCSVAKFFACTTKWVSESVANLTINLGSSSSVQWRWSGKILLHSNTYCTESFCVPTSCFNQRQTDFNHWPLKPSLLGLICKWCHSSCRQAKSYWSS